MEDLSRLEGAGIPILSSLNDNFQLFSSIVSCDDDLTTDTVIKSWLTGTSYIDPTWKNLFLILCLLGQDSMAQQIDVYLTKAFEEQQCEASDIMAEGWGVYLSS